MLSEENLATVTMLSSPSEVSWKNNMKGQLRLPSKESTLILLSVSLLSEDVKWSIHLAQLMLPYVCWLSLFSLTLTVEEDKGESNDLSQSLK